MWDRLTSLLGDLIFRLRDRADKRVREPRRRRDFSRVCAWLLPKTDRGRFDWRNSPLSFAAVALAGAAMVAVGVRVWARPARRVHVPSEAYYFDLNTGQLFAAPLGQRPPIEAPSRRPGPGGGPAGVRAYVYACGGCDPPAPRFIGFLETHSAQANEAIAASPSVPKPESAPEAIEPDLSRPGSPAPIDTPLMRRQQAAQLGRHVAPPLLTTAGGEPAWAAALSEEGERIIAEAYQKCPDNTARECQP